MEENRSLHSSLESRGIPHVYEEFDDNHFPFHVPIAIINKVVLSGKQLEQLPDLRLIAVAATGTDVVDKGWCQAHGITVSNISISANGHYLFADVRIAENMKPGDYPIKITTSSGTVNAPFSIAAAPPSH